MNQDMAVTTTYAPIRSRTPPECIWGKSSWATEPSPCMRHHLTVDVEEYFQVSAFESVVARACWQDYESRVGRSVDTILELMEHAGAKGTFFVLGWIAEHNPDVVRAIAAGGHEIASHGWDHRRIPAQSRDEFRHSVRRSKELLEDITGNEVIGFRAPSFSVLPGHEWALDVLLEEGYSYDSSLFPIRRPGYGYPDGQRIPHAVQRPTGQLMEFPPATLRFMGLNIPAAGGAYLRFFPYGVIRAAVRGMEAAGAPATLYVHPWELDPKQPRVCVSPVTRLRHYGGLRRTKKCLAKLLKEFRFRTIAATLARA